MDLVTQVIVLRTTGDNYHYEYNNTIIISITVLYNLNCKSGVTSNIDTILNIVKMEATLKDRTQ